MIRNIAVVLAGGSGQRFGADVPKQFMKVAGKTLLEHTLDIFQRSELIHEIAIVIHENFIRDAEHIVNQNGYSKVKKILIGGKDRNGSSLAAIRAYDSFSETDEIRLIFHDAVRPFLSDRIIYDVIEALKSYNAVDVAIPSTDTIIQVNEDNIITNIPNRNMLRNGQTPQAFSFKTIKQAYKLAALDANFKATDDCGVVLKYLPHEPVYVVQGSENNIKVTYELDLFIADKLFQIQHIEVLGNIPHQNLIGKVMVIFGGSYGIGYAIGEIAKKYQAKVYSFSRSQNSVDIKDFQSVKNAIYQVYQQEGKIDYVVNTAALLNKEPLMNMNVETLNEVIDVNFKGMVNVARASFEALKESKGHLLLFTSSSYTRGRAFYSIYSSTKAAVVNFTQAIAEEWREFGIRVNCINPERTKTPMRTSNFGDEPEESLLKPEVVAEVSINTLLSNFTGQVVYVKKN
ncbi:MAG TPA: bifunctional cytidylyltransferase/SDR family oxidoreductase [Salinivirgaceae bacterium]|nr:bifunctional cytidylyltransferase/SDR family oxidoreductase [Salinivirgaceae bacterium]